MGFPWGIERWERELRRMLYSRIARGIGLQVAPHRVTYLRDYARTTVAQHRAVFYALADVPAERLTLGEGCSTRLDCVGRNLKLRLDRGDQGRSRMFCSPNEQQRPGMRITDCSW